MIIGNYIRIYRKWQRLWGAMPVYLWVRAASAYKAGNYRMALSLYKRGLEKRADHPANCCARLDMATCYLKLGDYVQAQASLEYVAEQFPHSKEAGIRLARLFIRTGRPLEAATVLKRTLAHHPSDPKLAALLVFAGLENGGPSQLISAAVYAFRMIKSEDLNLPLLQTAKGCLALYQGRQRQGREILLAVIEAPDAPLEAYLALADDLLREDRPAAARRELVRAMGLDPLNPRLLSLLAETYLNRSGEYNPEYALQHALKAAQSSNWCSAREIATLAEAYFHYGDKLAALVTAEMAQDLGKKHCRIQNSRKLEKLIEALAGGTQV